jgi:hypothetical protein
MPSQNLFQKQEWPKRKNSYMPTSNKDNVERLMKEFSDALSERDKIFMVGLAQEGDEERAEKAPKEDEK